MARCCMMRYVRKELAQLGLLRNKIKHIDEDCALHRHYSVAGLIFIWICYSDVINRFIHL